MTESISVQNRSNIVIGDGLSSGFFYWTDDSDQTLSRSELYKYTSWAYGGKVALASDGTIATMDPAWNSESVTGLGAIIILSPGLDAQIVFANSPRALAFSANAQTLVIATGSDVVVYERFGDDKSYEAGVGIRFVSFGRVACRLAGRRIGRGIVHRHRTMYAVLRGRNRLGDDAGARGAPEPHLRP